MMSVTTDGLDAAIADMQAWPPKITKATVRSLNRAIGSAQTFMARAIAKDTTLKVGDVKSALTIQQATADRLTASLGASLKRLPLIQFGARGPEPSRGRGRGVSYNTGGSRTGIPNAFIATMRGSGHRGVFTRVSRTGPAAVIGTKRGNHILSNLGRLPIRELFGPSVGHVFAYYRDDGQQQAEDSFMTNFDHEVGFVAAAPPDDSGTN